MIYLIKVRYENITLLKIGYTEDNNWNKRMVQYKLHNPLCEFLLTIPEGTEIDEKRLHYKFKEYLWEGYGKEWFINSPDIINYMFTATLEDISKLPISPSLSKRRMTLVKDRKIAFLLEYVLSGEGRENITADSLKDILQLTRYDSTTPEEIFYDLQQCNQFPSITSKTWSEIKERLYPKFSPEINSFFFEYDQLTQYGDKLRYLCEYALSNREELVNAVINNLVKSDKVKQHFLALGPEKCLATGCNITKINKILGIKVFDQGILDSAILSNFSIGDRYLNKTAKELIKKLYINTGYKGAAKASILQDYFNVKITKVTIDRESGNGFEIVSVKPEYQNQYDLLRIGK